MSSIPVQNVTEDFIKGLTKGKNRKTLGKGLYLFYYGKRRNFMIQIQQQEVINDEQEPLSHKIRCLIPMHTLNETSYFISNYFNSHSLHTERHVFEILSGDPVKSHQGMGMYYSVYQEANHLRPTYILYLVSFLIFSI